MAGKKGGTTAATTQKPTEKQDIRVRIDRLFDDPQSKLKGIASANIGDFAVHGFRIYENENGLFVSMPSTSYKDSKGDTKYDDIFHPVTKEAREDLCNAIRDSYSQALTEAQSNVQNPQSEQVQKM